MFRQFFLLASFLLVSSQALAGTIATVDFQRAVTETDEGKSAQKRIDTMYETRRSEIEKMQAELEQEMKDFQSRAMILSDGARAEAEQSLMAKQQRFQQTAMQYEGELQQQYGVLLQELDTKMRSLAITIAKEKQFDLVIDSAVVVYHGGDVVDMTSDLVIKYNAIHK